MLPSFCSQKITRYRAVAVKDERGSKMPNWETAQAEVIENVSVQPQDSYISQDGRILGIKDTYKVYVNPGSDVCAGDRIEWEGCLYTVDEAPRVWTSPTGRVSNIQFTMTQWRG